MNRDIPAASRSSKESFIAILIFAIVSILSSSADQLVKVNNFIEKYFKNV